MPEALLLLLLLRPDLKLSGSTCYADDGLSRQKMVRFILTTQGTGNVCRDGRLGCADQGNGGGHKAGYHKSDSAVLDKHNYCTGGLMDNDKPPINFDASLTAAPSYKTT